jgi:hypothetical protein
MFLFKGTYPDFTAKWYQDVGSMLCMTLFLNAFTPHVSKLVVAQLGCLFRCLDRGCKCHARKNIDSDDINTK